MRLRFRGLATAGPLFTKKEAGNNPGPRSPQRTTGWWTFRKPPRIFIKYKVIVMQLTKNYKCRKWCATNHSILNEDGREIAYLREVTAPKGEDQLANCKLMAAAPTLVEALIDQIEETQNLLRLINSIEFKPKPSVIDLAGCVTEKARAALVKAGVITD